MPTEYFTHDGHRLAYEVHGEGDELVVYLHGLLLDANLNRAIADALAQRGNRVVLLDLLGHGRSDKPAHASAYRMDVYVDQVMALLDHLGADDAVLGGLSLGANVSLLAAAHHPDRVRGLVLEMPVLEWATPGVAMTFVPLLLAVHYTAGPTGWVTSLIGRLPRTGRGPLDSLMNAASLEPDVIAAILHGVLLGPVCPTVEERRAIAVPTLILAHERDYIHPFNDAVNLSKQVPDARLVRAHSPLELRLHPERLTFEVAEFVDRVWRRPPVSARPRSRRAPEGARRPTRDRRASC
jgi:pimeloyl-ACP methyl ester carboxylesterase